MSSPIGDLLRVAGSRWKVEHVLNVWTAERSDPDGRHLHYLVATSTSELTTKILRADEEDAQQ
jgi:hypothetical protein